MNYTLNHLKELEAESIFVIRETAAQFQNPVMLFSGGKDSESILPCQDSISFDAC
jgi:sulfate adenylyltransferase subunit 2